MVYHIVNFRLFCNGDDWGMVYGSVLIIYYFASGYLTQRTGESQVNHQKNIYEWAILHDSVKQPEGKYLSDQNPCCLTIIGVSIG